MYRQLAIQKQMLEGTKIYLLSFCPLILLSDPFFKSNVLLAYLSSKLFDNFSNCTFVDVVLENAFLLDMRFKKFEVAWPI